MKKVVSVLVLFMFVCAGYVLGPSIGQASAAEASKCKDCYYCLKDCNACSDQCTNKECWKNREQKNCNLTCNNCPDKYCYKNCQQCKEQGNCKDCSYCKNDCKQDSKCYYNDNCKNNYGKNCANNSKYFKKWRPKHHIWNY